MSNNTDFKPKKHLGQNFLQDRGVLKEIVGAAEIQPDDIILEIGPGLGILTAKLAKRAKRVIAIEKDERLVKILKKKFKDFKKIEIIKGDVLQTNIKNVIASERAKRPSVAISDDNYNNTTGLLRPTSGRARNDKMYYKVVANLPYYITSPVIRKFLEAENQPRLMVLMVQKEVAERICAKPPNMSLFAVACQLYSKPEIIKIVKKESFWPKPKVDSAIIKLKIKKSQPPPEFREKFFKIVKAGFSSPRKQLKNNLKKFFRDKTEKILEKAGINPTRRAETLSIEDWLKIYNVV